MDSINSQTISNIIASISLIVSIIIYVSTALTNKAERTSSVERAQFQLFIESIDAFLDKIDAQTMIDYQDMIYNEQNKRENYARHYATIQRLISEVNYRFQVVLLYKPQDSEVVKSIMVILENLKTKFSLISDTFANDLDFLYSNENSANYLPQKAEASYLQATEYNRCYISSIALLFEGLSVLQKLNNKNCSHNDKTSYLKKYESFMTDTSNIN